MGLVTDSLYLSSGCAEVDSQYGVGQDSSSYHDRCTLGLEVVEEDSSNTSHFPSAAGIVDLGVNLRKKEV